MSNISAKSRRILFAEDDDSMRRFVEVILRKENYEVVAVEDGLKAMQSALKTDFDVIIADAMMPNMTGFDLCRMLRQNDGKKHIPLIILSGLEQDTTGKAENCLADYYLAKDGNLKGNLIQTLADILG
jgi:CheY-like chemotaxis protein